MVCISLMRMVDSALGVLRPSLSVLFVSLIPNGERVFFMDPPAPFGPRLGAGNGVEGLTRYTLPQRVKAKAKAIAKGVAKSKPKLELAHRLRLLVR